METENNTLDKSSSEKEQDAIIQLLGRVPNALEEEIIRTLWQEKFSKKGLEKWFRKLLKTSENIIKTSNKNESYVQLNDEIVLKFSVSSQNTLAHKYPFSAASIAIQNVVKSTVSDGFKPIALFDSLRIGDFEDINNQKKLIRIIKAISEFSKAVNIPIIGGEIFFNQSFNQIPVINTFAIGINSIENLKRKKIILPGHEIYLVGAYTDLESSLNYEGENQFNKLSQEEDITSFSAENFQEKLVNELCDHLNDSNAFTIVQNIERGGIIQALNQILKGKRGARIYVDKIKTSFKKLSLLQILFSESPARALFVVNKKSKPRFQKIIKNSGLSVQNIGEIIDGNNIEIHNNNEIIANFPSEILQNQNIPERDIFYKKPDKLNNREYSIKDIPLPDNLQEVAWFLLQHKNISSKKHLTKHFKLDDSEESNELSDASILTINDNLKLAIAIDCNSRYVHACPQTGAAIAVAEAARNIVCSGAKPIALSTCINIGNSKKPEVFWQFTEIIKGINKVSREYNLPVINIKSNFENFTLDGEKEKNIYPTPTIAMIGIIEKPEHQLSLHFKNKGDMIFLLGETQNSISSSLYLKSYHKVKNSPPPYFDLKTADKLQKTVRQLAENQLINSAHDISNGGLLITLIEAALELNLGFDITTDAENRSDAFLFGEAQNRIIVTVSPEHEIDFIDFMIETKFPFLTLGHVTKGGLRVDDESWGNITEAKELFENTMENNFQI